MIGRLTKIKGYGNDLQLERLQKAMHIAELRERGWSHRRIARVLVENGASPERIQEFADSLKQDENEG